MEDQKINFQLKVESYLEKNKVYDILEYFLKQIIIDKPEDPIEYLIDAFNKPPKKIFLVVSPITIQSIDDQLQKKLQLPLIQTSNLVQQQLQDKKSPHHELVKEYINYGMLLPEEVIHDIVFTRIQQLMKEQNYKGFVLSGFPRTRLQVLALQSRKIIADKLIVVETSRDYAITQLKKKIKERQKTINEQDLEMTAEKKLLEYEYNIESVKELYQGNFHVFQFNGTNADQLFETISIKQHSYGPRRPPAVLVLGPPSCYKKAVAEQISEDFGLVCISLQCFMKHYLKQVGQKKELKKMQQSDLLNDEIVYTQINERIQESDCKAQGFIIEGFPRTEKQLENMKFTPSLVVMLELEDYLIYQKMMGRMLDPVTGIYYTELPQNTEIQERLVHFGQNEIRQLKKRIKQWKDIKMLLEMQFREQLLKIKVKDLDQHDVVQIIKDHMVNSVGELKIPQ